MTLISKYQLDLIKKLCYWIVSRMKLILFLILTLFIRIFFHSSNSVKQFDYIVLQIMYETSSPLTVYLRALRSAGGKLFFGFVNF